MNVWNRKEEAAEIIREEIRVYKERNWQKSKIWLYSAQTGLVPQFSVKLRSAHLWESQVMVEHFSDLSYVHLMIITNREENLALKTAFER